MNYGDIVQLGRHRLMCGDATNYGDIEALLDGRKVDLVLTDPPYGVNIVKSGSWMKRYRDIKNDTPEDALNVARAHWGIVQDISDAHIFWGGQFFAHFLPISRSWLVWDKCRSNKFSFSSCELAWSNTGGNRNWYYKQFWNGAFGKKSPLNPCPHVHPTQKPVELHAHILEDFSQEGDLILDCFGGSGTTLIACEISNRTCCMMELSPDYCDVIVNRYTTLTKGALSFG